MIIDLHISSNTILNQPPYRSFDLASLEGDDGGCGAGKLEQCLGLHVAHHEVDLRERLGPVDGEELKITQPQLLQPLPLHQKQSSMRCKSYCARRAEMSGGEIR